jgi:O-antigen/teichoic acid export membrane protein
MTVGLRGRLRRHLDPQTRGFLRDSLKLGAGSGVVLVGYAAQITLIAHVLGLREYGIFVIVVSTVDLISRLVDFQVGQMTTAFAADSLRTQPRRTIGIAQFSYLVDLGAGILGFLVVILIAPMAAEHLLDGESWTLFALYGLTMLATTTETTSIALLQLFGRFGSILRLTVVRECMRVTLVLVALLATHSVEGVIVALFTMEVVMAVLWAVAADRGARERPGGVGLRERAISETKGMRREMARMVVHTNVISYVKVLAAQGPTLLLGAMRTPTEAGLYKIGTSVAVIVGKPADPAWAAVLPRLAKLRAAGRGAEMRALIRQASIGAFLLISALGAVTILLREPVLRIVGGREAVAAGTVLILSVLARVVNGTLFWNSPLLYALKRAASASRVFIGCSLVFVPVLLVFIDRWGAAGAAGALLVWSLVVNAGLTFEAFRAMRAVPSTPVPSAAAPA